MATSITINDDHQIAMALHAQLNNSSDTSTSNASGNTARGNNGNNGNNGVVVVNERAPHTIVPVIADPDKTEPLSFASSINDVLVADTALLVNNMGLRLSRGNDGRTLYCGRRYAQPGGCYCGGCQGFCGPASGCFCPSCAMVAPNNPRRVHPSSLTTNAQSQQRSWMPSSTLPEPYRRRRDACDCDCGDCQPRLNCEKIWVCFLGFIAISIYACAVALLWYTWKLYFDYHDVYCEKPLTKYLLAFDIVSLIPHLVGLCAIMCYVCELKDMIEAISPILGCIGLVQLAILITGSVMVFQIDRNDHLCPAPLYDFTWGWNIACWALSGLICCLACCFMLLTLVLGGHS